MIAGWTEDDATLFTPSTIKTSEETVAFINLYFPSLNSTSVSKLLSLYPTSDFAGNPSANLSAEFYRSAQITRDINFSCPSFYFGYATSKKAENVYFYPHNQTIFGPYPASIELPGLASSTHPSYHIRSVTSPCMILAQHISRCPRILSSYARYRGRGRHLRA